LILIVAFTAAVIGALLCGGSLSHLALVKVRAGWLVIGVFLVQGWIIYSFYGELSGPWDWRGIILIISYLLLIIFLWLNRHLNGAYLILLGVLLNFTVIVANGGFMPVTVEALERAGQLNLVDEPKEWVKVKATKDVILSREKTKLWFLTDVFVIPPPCPITSVFSPGDVLAGVGVFYFFFKTLRRGRDNG